MVIISHTYRIVLIMKKMMTAALITTSTDSALWVIGRCSGCSFSMSALRPVRGSAVLSGSGRGAGHAVPLLAAGEAAGCGLFSCGGAANSNLAREMIKTTSKGRLGFNLLRSGTTGGEAFRGDAVRVLCAQNGHRRSCWTPELRAAPPWPPWTPAVVAAPSQCDVMQQLAQANVL
ncbi:hypothetical protein NDU88_004967 [Pleurodeles waltl]|uniref:Uncharacterized protein n=1 Tax=Pleurodeles waltl TaxID=8319 RepID=A0AAV7MVD8_PLEWA|nr:hypothetical protein NDU88_004967 [Pleurodeles waltl]